MRRAPERRAPRWRLLVAGLALLVLAFSLARSLEPGRTLLRGHRLVRALAGEPLPPPAAAFWFDPDYPAFLADVKAATPETATVAVLVPKKPDVYLYQASYQLAPRRVVAAEWMDDAAFVATYRAAAAPGPGGRPIAHGRLWAR